MCNYNMDEYYCKPMIRSNKRGSAAVDVKKLEELHKAQHKKDRRRDKLLLHAMDLRHQHACATNSALSSLPTKTEAL